MDIYGELEPMSYRPAAHYDFANFKVKTGLRIERAERLMIHGQPLPRVHTRQGLIHCALLRSTQVEAGRSSLHRRATGHRMIWGPAGNGMPDLASGLRAWRHGTGEVLSPEGFVLARAIAGEEAIPEQVLNIEEPGGAGRAVVHCAAIPIRNEDGTLRAVIVVLEDITERTQRE